MELTSYVYLITGRNLESLVGGLPKSAKFVATIVDDEDVPAVALPFIGVDSQTPRFDEELVFSLSPRAFCSRIRNGLKVKVEVRLVKLHAHDGLI